MQSTGGTIAYPIQQKPIILQDKNNAIGKI